MSNLLVNTKALREVDLNLENIFKIMFHNGENTACEFTEKGKIVKWSYEVYRVKVFKAASKILKTVGKNNQGCYVALKMPNSPLWPIMFWGILAAGFKPILIDSSLNDEMTNFLVEQSAAKAVIDSPVNFEGEKELSSSNWENEVALCTSGTTSTSKIFTYSGEALCYQLLNLEIFTQNKFMNPEPGDKTLAFLPFHHVFGFIAQYLAYSFFGAAMVYTKDRAPETLINACREHGVTHILTVPLLLNNLSNGITKKLKNSSILQRIFFRLMLGTGLSLQKINLDFGLKVSKGLFKNVLNNLLGHQIKVFICGGSHIPYETIKIINGIGYYVTCGYGMTELGIASCQFDYSLKTRLTSPSGQKLKHMEYKVDNTEGNNTGELLVKGKAIHTGTLVNGQKLESQLTPDGWFKTGDIVKVNGSTSWIKGRIKDIIINESGENIYPDELENCFSKLPLVNNLCILGTFKNKSYEYITLVLSLDNSDINNKNLEELIGIINGINGNLPIAKKINKVYITPGKLPLVNGIKVKRNKLREMIENAEVELIELDLKNKSIEIKSAQNTQLNLEKELEEDLAEIKAEIKKCFSEVLEIPEADIRDDSHFINDLGGDSLSSIGLRIKIEELFNIVIPDVDYYQCNNVQDIALLILRKTKGMPAAAETATTHNDLEIKLITKFEDSPEYKSFTERQQSVASSENPYFVCHDSVIRDVSMVNGKTEVLNFGSYNYIGMSGHPETVRAAKEAAERYGTSASGSRLLAGEKHLYQELEKEIASWKHTEAALVLVGGHSTNVTFVGNFCNNRDLILYDALAHNSIVQGCQLSKSDSKAFPHNDYKTLEIILKNARNKYEKILVAIEGAYSMDGDIAPLPQFVELKKKYGFFLMVDEAHSACVIGEHGGGVDEYFKLHPKDIDIKMGTLSKGLGTCGGYLAGDRALIEYLRYNVPGFVFSVGISPPVAAATLQALKILRHDNSAVKRLHKNIDTFVKEARDRNLNTCLAGETAVVPILVGKDEDAFKLSQLLLKRGISVPPAVYPAVPKDQARLRFCVTSEHKEEQIKGALDTLMDISREFGIIIPNK